MNISYNQLSPSPESNYRQEGVMISPSDHYAFVCPSIGQMVVVETAILRQYITTKNPLTVSPGKSIGALVPLADVKYKTVYFDHYCHDLIASLSDSSKDTDKSKVAESIFHHFCPHAKYNHVQPQNNWDFVVKTLVSGKEYKVEVKWDKLGGAPNLYCELYTQPKTQAERDYLFGS